MKSSRPSSQTGQLKVKTPTGMSSRMPANSDARTANSVKLGPSLGSSSSLVRIDMSLAPGVLTAPDAPISEEAAHHMRPGQVPDAGSVSDRRAGKRRGGRPLGNEMGKDRGSHRCDQRDPGRLVVGGSVGQQRCHHR